MGGHTDQGRLVAGRYRLLEMIGRGGMGTVWRAEDELLDRQVAVKKLHPPQPHMADDELATLFERTRREARAAARISHPNVVVVHDVVDDEGLPSIVMEYVPSVTLGDHLKRQGALPPAEAARIGRGMIAALRAAHRAGVLHRDVKPGNVLLGEDSRVVLTDFGIAQASGTSTLTRTGEIIGSIDFLSPERIRGAAPGPEADLWALGATLYQAVEGRSPFRRPTAIETAYAIAAEPLQPPAHAGALTPVIAGLLAKEPAERPSVQEVERMLRLPAADQDTALVAQPGAEPPTAPTVRAAATAPTPPLSYAPVPPPRAAAHPPPPRRRTGRWLAAAVGAALLLAAAAAIAANRHGSGGPEADPTTAPTAAPSPTTTIPPTRPPATTPPPPPPPGYHLAHQSGRGYVLPVPDGWTKKVTGDGEQVDFIDPTHLVDLKVSALTFGSSDPFAHFLRLEPQTRSQVRGYRRELLEPTRAQGRRAAIWQFTFRGTVRDFRAIDLDFATAGGREYAVYLSAPKAQWDTYRRVFDTAVQGFRQTSR